MPSFFFRTKKADASTSIEPHLLTMSGSLPPSLPASPPYHEHAVEFPPVSHLPPGFKKAATAPAGAHVMANVDHTLVHVVATTPARRAAEPIVARRNSSGAFATSFAPSRGRAVF